MQHQKWKMQEKANTFWRFKWEMLQCAIFRLRTIPFLAAPDCILMAEIGHALLSPVLVPLLAVQSLLSVPTAHTVLSQSCSQLAPFETQSFKLLFLAWFHPAHFPGPFSSSNLAVWFVTFSGTWWQMRTRLNIEIKMPMCYLHLLKVDLGLTETSMP